MKSLLLARYFLIQTLFCILCSTSIFGQVPNDDGRRYLALQLLNDDEIDPNLNAIQAAHNFGINAVSLTVRWDAIQCPDCNCNSMYWTQLDDQVTKAKQLNMKIAFRIHLHSADVNRFQDPCFRSNNLWGTPTAANMKGLLGNGNIQDFSDGFFNKTFPMTNQTAINNAKGFIEQVINRYNAAPYQLITENRLLFVSIATNSQQEAGYPFGTGPSNTTAALFDYSEEMKGAYRAWHMTNYGTIVDPPQSTDLLDKGNPYSTEANKRWYIFRHKVLKDFLTDMCLFIKNKNQNIRVINDFGSVFDDPSIRRGTFGFKNLTCSMDGIKVNDAHAYNHRFSMDLLRTNLPNKWIMNEAFLTENGIPNPGAVRNLIDESFEHGAKFVSIVMANVNTVNTLSSQISEMANKWVTGSNGNMTTINPVGSSGPYNLSQILAGSQSYDMSTYNQPKSIILNEDIPEISNCTICDPPSPPAISPTSGSVCASTNQTVTLNSSGCSGTVTWSNGQTGSSLVVSQPNTYTATCTVNNCTSGSSNTATITQASGCGSGSCGNGTGLTATYFNGHDLEGSPIATFTQGPINIAGNQGQTISGTSIAGINVSARWEGQIEAPIGGSYTFNMRTDDGVRVWFNNNQVVNDYGYYGATDHNFTVNLNAGQKYNIKIEWKQGGGDYEAKLFWSYPNQATEIVPSCWMYATTGNTCNFSISAGTSNATPSCGAAITLTANCSGSDCSSVSYAWSNSAGAVGNGSSINVNAPSSNGNHTYTVTASKAGCNNQTATITITVNNCSPSSCLMNKVRLKFRDDCCLDRLQGAQIQGSNDGINWNNVYTINTNGTGEWQTFTFNTVTYPQVRFVAGPNGFGELREIEFYYDDTKLTGQGFGNGSQSANETWEKAMDDNLTNLWHGPWSPNWLPGVNNYVGLILNCNSTPSCSNTGSISYEKWNNIGIGSNISDFRSATNNLTTTPNLTQSLTLFEAPSNIDDQYGARIRGYVCAPVSGNYTFWIAGDDGCELWLSSDDNPANIQKIAYHNGSTGSQQWNVSSTQQSNTISLLAGQRYYIEALVKEGFGNDNLAVGWQLPNGTLERPIPGNRLIPFGGSSRIGVEKESILLLEETSNSVQLYPNPNQGKVNLRYYLAKGEKANLTFVNVGGNIITQKTLEGEGVWKQDQTDLTSQPNGIYLLRFEAEGKLITRKFLIAK